MNKLLTALRLRVLTLFGRVPKGDLQLTDSKIIGVMDLSKKQQDDYRKHRRRILLVRSLPGMIPVLLVALWFLLPTPLTQQAINNFLHKNDHAARLWLTPLTWTSPEPFVSAFNSGTVDTRLGNYVTAQTELQRALTLAPAAKRCMVIQNLVYLFDARAASLKGKSQATQYTNQASTLKKTNAKCFLVIVSKSQATSDKSGGGGGGSQSDSPNASQPQQLLQKNQQGQASQQPNINQLIINVNSPSNKPW